MNSHKYAMKSLILRNGVEILINTKYKLAEDVNGESEIKLEDCFGISEGQSFLLGGQPVAVRFVDPSTKTVGLVNPAGTHPKGTWLEANNSTKCMSISRYRRVTQEQLEYVRKVRVADDEVVNYGSQVQYMDYLHFVTGFDQDDLSKVLKLRESNCTVTINRLSAGQFNGFSYDQQPVNICSNVPGYFEYVNSTLLLQEPGYTPSTISYVMIPDEFEINPLDQVEISVQDSKYKVTSIDRSRVKNMLYLAVDYDVAR